MRLFQQIPIFCYFEQGYNNICVHYSLANILYLLIGIELASDVKELAPTHRDNKDGFLGLHALLKTSESIKFTHELRRMKSNQELRRMKRKGNSFIPTQDVILMSTG